MSRALVRSASDWIRQNHPDPDAMYSTTDNGFLIEAEAAYLVALDEYRQLLAKKARHRANDLMWGLPPKAWVVYQLIDRTGRVLYVGMTGKPKTRVRQHLLEFGDRIDRVDFQRFGSRVEAYDAETKLIAYVKPPMNIAKVPD